MHIVSAHSTISDPRNIRAIAEYLSGLDMNPEPVVGSANNLELGWELYTHNCVTCHGIHGQGNLENRVPRVAKRHYPYSLGQLEEVAQLHRKFATAEIAATLSHLRTEEKDALADYISRLGDSEAPLDLRPSDAGRKLDGPISP